MTKARVKADGLPYRLYERVGKFKVSYGYKLPNGTWAFRLSAQRNNVSKAAEIRSEAIYRANMLNGSAPTAGSTTQLFKEYFEWQHSLPRTSEDRKADNIFKVNAGEANHILRVFGHVAPSAIKPSHIYLYLMGRATEGAPAKANKEVALLSAVLEYGRRHGVLEVNPCRDVKHNKTRPKTTYVTQNELKLVMATARQLGGSFLTVALSLQFAYLTVCRPDETRHLTRMALDETAGVSVPVERERRAKSNATSASSGRHF